MNIDYSALAAAAETVAAQPKPVDEFHHIDEFFRTTLAATLAGYEVREEQIRMARTIAQALAEGRHCIAEAGTGTGKSLAYLVPVIQHARNRCRAIVSTGTIALQEQLVNKDLPLLAELFPGIRFAIAKGKSNYVCPARWREIADKHGDGGLLSILHDVPLFAWVAGEECTGDKSDFPGDPGPDWSKICVDDSCPGISKCPHSSECFYARARAAWDQADIIVCNHTLLMIHLALQADSDGFAGILPEAGVVVLDEAHHLEGEARRAWEIQVSSLRLPMLLAQAAKLAPQIPAEDIEAARAANESFFAQVRAVSSEQTFTLDSPPACALLDELVAATKPIERALGANEDNQRAVKLAEQVSAFRFDICAAACMGSADCVHWVEVNTWGKNGERVTLHQTPVNVAPALRESLWGAYPTVVATSATLAAGGRFDYYRQQVGCPSALELVVDSPFDYKQQGLMFVPKPGTVPEPKDNPNYYTEIAPLVQDILERTDGRAFVLFTSYRGMNEVYDLLLPRLRWQVLKQGDAPKHELLSRFRQEHSVLFATASFWEGVDVPGEALSAVILTALPFAVPTDPVTQARVAAIKSQGRNDFAELMLPEMILRLKQGVGRLIRTRSDRGLVAILDTRIRTKRYGFTVLESLPRFKRIESLENVEVFLADKHEPAA